MNKIELYHNDMSSCSQKIRLVLSEKNIEWTGHHMNLRAGNTRTREYINNLNPNGVVPTLICDGDIIIESTVIMEFLDEKFPKIPLKPLNPVNVAKMRLWNKKIDEGIHAATAVISSCIAFRHQHLNNKPYEEVEEMINRIPDENRRKINYSTIFEGIESQYFGPSFIKFDKLFGELDNHLEKHKWLSGDTYSLADASYTPYLTRFEHLNLEKVYSKRKNLIKWFLKIKKRKNYFEEISKWLNQDYLKLMMEKGIEAKSKVSEIFS